MPASIKSTTPFQFYRRLAYGGDGVAIQTITAALTITPYYEEMIALNPSTGTRVVTLPTTAQGAKKGMWHLIFNSGTTYSLTINRPAATTLTTLAPGQSCHVVYSGTAWTLVHAPAGASSLQGASTFKSTEQTGTGAPQTVAHGLGSIPAQYFAVPSNLTGGAYVVSAESADATNVTLTVTLGEKFKIIAFK
jgi:hypothetical protein